MSDTTATTVPPSEQHPVGFDETARGEEAIYPGSFIKFCEGFLYFVILFGGALGIALAVVAMTILNIFGLDFTMSNTLLTLLFGALVGMFYSGLYGYGWNDRNYNSGMETWWGLALWWGVNPPGLFFNLPWPFGYQTQAVPVTENSLDLHAAEVEAADNVDMEIDYTVVYRIKYPLTFLRWDGEGGPSRAFGAFLNRNIRWLVSLKKSVDLTAVREHSSLALAGRELFVTVSKYNPETEEMEDTQVPFASDEEGRGSIREIAAEMGFEIIRVFLVDPNLPPEIKAAAARARIEEIQAEYERTQQRTRLRNTGLMVRYLDMLTRRFPGIDAEAAYADAQLDAEATQVRKVIIQHTGTRPEGADFATGAAVRAADTDGAD